jgi:hypothetical protein
MVLGVPDERTPHASARHGAADYLCDNCGAPTSVCVAPGCPNLANRGFRGLSTPKYCAEHRHDIPGFEKLEQRLQRIEDYGPWLKYEKPNLSRMSRVIGVAAVGGVALAPVAFLAAPAIGGAIGAATGLSGAAATSHGLALLGGGSLAAGGLGMAGGTTVVTALGGGLGTALGAITTAAYVSTDSSFKIEKLRGGRGTPILFAAGFLTGGLPDGANGKHSSTRAIPPHRCIGCTGGPRS